MTDPHRIVITGLGVVSPNGVGRQTFDANCRAGRSGVKAIDAFDLAGLKSRYAGVVSDFDPLAVMPAADVRRTPRMVPFAVAAAKEALDHACLRIAEDDIARQRRIGVSLGTGGGGLGFVEDQYRRMFAAGGRPSPFAITAGTHGNLASELSIQLKFRGPSHVLSTGCTSATDALGHAVLMLRAGMADMMIAGGADSPIMPGILAGFELMGVLSTREHDAPALASRPFNADRDGFILGEGAWMFVLETAEHAERRGVKPLAELAGYASTCDAFHRVQIAPDLAECTRAMQEAMASAGVRPADVDYVNLHGTGTQLNDKLESAAIKRVFEERAKEIPTSATKSFIGHPQGAGGAAGLAATVLMMQSGHLHPTINLTRPDAECDLDYVPNTSRPHRIDVALCNCIAFGSKNSAIVLKRVGD